MRKLSITVRGARGIGKTWVVLAIEQTLKQYGIEAVVVSLEQTPMPMRQLPIPQRVAKDLAVTIVEEIG